MEIRRNNFFQQCGKLTSIINELSVKASRALKHAADVIADSPAALQVIISSSDILIIMIFMVITIIGNIIIIVFMIIMIFPAPLPANAEQHLCREQQHHHLPNSHRHHLATLHCQTNPEKGAFSFGQRGPLVLPSIGPYVGKNSHSVLLLFHKIMDYTVLKLG